MDVVLDETSLVPGSAPGGRIKTLGRTLKALDTLGAPQVLRTVRDAADLDIAEGQGLRFWCFHKGTDRDWGRLVALRLGKQPYIDGPDGLFAQAEGARAIEALFNGTCAVGLGLAGLKDGVGVALADARPAGHVQVQLNYLDESGDTAQEHISVLRLVDQAQVDAHQGEIRARLDRQLVDGADLLQKAAGMLPRLIFCPMAQTQIAALAASDERLPSLLRHLRELNRCAQDWQSGPFEPSVSWSVESPATLNHGSYGPDRDFPVPPNFNSERWSCHTKFAAGFRLYFRFEASVCQVLIGYYGPHLRTTKFH